MSQFHTAKMVKAKKPHRCAECRDIIEPGETYERNVGNWEGDFYAYKLCLLCDRAWRWAIRRFSMDPEDCGVGDLPTFIIDSRDTVYDIRIAEYIRRGWRNRVTGERYAFPEVVA